MKFHLCEALVIYRTQRMCCRILQDPLSRRPRSLICLHVLSPKKNLKINKKKLHIRFNQTRELAAKWNQGKMLPMCGHQTVQQCPCQIDPSDKRHPLYVLHLENIE